MAFSFFKKKSSDQKNTTEAPAGKIKYHQLVVREIIKETNDAVSIVFEQPEQKIQYKPGQYLTLSPIINGKKVRRAYSLCSSPYTDAYPAVTVKKVEGGLVSNFLNDKLKAGDSLEVMEPLGSFIAEPEEGRKRHLILLGGGSGITPLISITKSILFAEPGSRISLIYANRNEHSIIFQDQIKDLQQKYGERFHVTHVLDEAPVSWECRSGLLKPELLKELLSLLPQTPLAETAYYLCGPEGMMENVLKTFEELRIPKEMVHRESFLSGAASPGAAASGSAGKVPGGANPEAAAGDDVPQARMVTIIMNGEEYKFTVQPDKTILETGLEQDIDMPYSCQSGLCTACRGKCLSGKVKLDESDGLSQGELDEGYVLPCVGHPLTDDVVIEID